MESKSLDYPYRTNIVFVSQNIGFILFYDTPFKNMNIFNNFGRKGNCTSFGKTQSKRVNLRLSPLTE